MEQAEAQLECFARLQIYFLAVLLEQPSKSCNNKNYFEADTYYHGQISQDALQIRD